MSQISQVSRYTIYPIFWWCLSHSVTQNTLTTHPGPPSTWTEVAHPSSVQLKDKTNKNKSKTTNKKIETTMSSVICHRCVIGDIYYRRQWFWVVFWWPNSISLGASFRFLRINAVNTTIPSIRWSSWTIEDVTKRPGSCFDLANTRHHVSYVQHAQLSEVSWKWCSQFAFHGKLSESTTKRKMLYCIYSWSLEPQSCEKKTYILPKELGSESTTVLHASTFVFLEVMSILTAEKPESSCLPF